MPIPRISSEDEDNLMHDVTGSLSAMESAMERGREYGDIADKFAAWWTQIAATKEIDSQEWQNISEFQAKLFWLVGGTIPRDAGAVANDYYLAERYLGFAVLDRLPKQQCPFRQLTAVQAGVLIRTTVMDARRCIAYFLYCTQPEHQRGARESGADVADYLTACQHLDEAFSTCPNGSCTDCLAIVREAYRRGRNWLSVQMRISPDDLSYCSVALQHAVGRAILAPNGCTEHACVNHVTDFAERIRNQPEQTSLLEYLMLCMLPRLRVHYDV